jgi:hypothetical protein
MESGGQKTPGSLLRSKFLVIATAGYLKRLEEAAKEKKRAAEENKQGEQTEKVAH